MKFGTIILAAMVALIGTVAYSQTSAPGGPAAKQGDRLIQKQTSKQRAARIRKGVTTGRAIPNTPGSHQGAVDPASQHSTPDYDDGDS